MQIDQTLAAAMAGTANYINEGTPIISGAETDHDRVKKAESMEITASGSVYMKDATYLRPENKKDEETAAEKLENENGLSAEARRNQMAVLANTTSPEDLAKMQEEGYSILDTDSRTIITVTDKIKAALAKAGVDISVYGDSMSEEELKEITGSDAVANSIARELKKNDLPVTEDNLDECQKAYEQTEFIGELDDGTVRYLMKNELPPTIDNIYRAKHSYRETPENTSQTGERLSDADFEALSGQIEKIITDAGLEVNDTTKEQSKWILQNGLPLTGENLLYLNQLENFTTPQTNQIISAMAEAVAEGNRPMDGMLIGGYSLMDQAKEAMEVISDATDEDLAQLLVEGKDLTIENLKSAGNRSEDVVASDRGIAFLTARRQLEEVRLVMTTEANYALLKKGISIDTRPLAELVEDLKNQEESYYRDLMAQSGQEGSVGIGAAGEKAATAVNAVGIISDLKGYPANILNLEYEEDTLNSLHERGRILKDTYMKANESYEALMTAPRADMGDSMKKAFRNIDDILQDLNLETSEENRRAVRILAYNRTEITEENIALMKAKDEEVQRAFSNMTPQVTVEMIRREINPLDMELSELNKVAESIKAETGAEEQERFSKYLWKLEQNREITEEEKSTYIGIYRLIAQVEKTDGAAIGSMMNQGADITMRNLLAAVRTGKKGSMDYRVDDTFAGADAVSRGPRIDDQIMVGYQTNCIKDALEQMNPSSVSDILQQDWEDMTPEQFKEAIQQAAATDTADAGLEKAYLDEQMSQLTEVLASPEEVYALLERNEMPNTVYNVLAAEQMMRDPGQMFRTLFRPRGVSDDRMQAVSEMKEQVLERFGEAVKTPEELAEAQKELAELAEHAMQNMIIENDSVSTLDLREMRLAMQQFSLCAKQSKEENYMIPMQVGDEITGVSLKIVRGHEKKGLVDILFRGSIMGKVAASFDAKENGISGMIATDNPDTRDLLTDCLTGLTEKLGENGEEVDLRIAYIPDLSLEHYSENRENRSTKEQDNSANTAQDSVQTSRLYHIAESFIGVVQELDLQ